MLLRTLACLIASTLYIASAHALDSATPDSEDVRMITTIQEATQAADLQTLTQLYEHPSSDISKALAAMALERVRYNLDASTKDAKLCEESLFETQAVVAHFCARFAAGNLRLAGQYQTAATAEVEIAQRYSGKLPKASLLNPDVEQAKLYSGLPSMHVERSEANVSVPTFGMHSGRYKIEATVNDHAVQLQIDSGATTTLGVKTAEALGVKILLEADGKVRSMWGGDHGTKKLGLIEHLNFSGVSLENVLVAIVPEERNLLGINVLSKLGAMKFTPSEWLLYGATATKPDCNTPMLIGSPLWGGAPKLVTYIGVDDARRTAVIDTGSAFYLTGMSSTKNTGDYQAARRTKVYDMGSNARSVRMSRSTSTVTLGGQTVELTYNIFNDATAPYDYLLGIGSLRDFDVFLDFTAHHLCVIPD